MLNLSKYLTRQQQLAVCVIIFLLLTGWAVRAWRQANPPAPKPVSQTQ